MTPEQTALTELERCRHVYDENPEMAHQEADAVLLAYLRETGHGDISDAYHRVGRRFYDAPYWWGI